MRAGFARDLLKSALLALFLPTTLTACASLGGSPVPVIGVGPSVNLAQRYPIDEALRAFHDDSEDDLRQGLSPQQYRDMVVTVYLNAIDSRYFEFRTALSSERRELGTGFDFAILGLTTMASVARDSIVNSLSATASVMTGTRSSIDRNLYFDQTLPGLLAAMETARLRVLTRITQNLGKSDLEYPLETAFADLRAYEMAASLDGAIGEITATASAQREAAAAELATVVQACEVVDDSAIDLTDRLARFVHDLADPSKATASDSLAARTQALQQVGRLVGISSDMLISASPAQIDTLIRRRLAAGVDGRCAAANYQSLIDQIRAQTERTVQP
jgi:hypothetical protein